MAKKSEVKYPRKVPTNNRISEHLETNGEAKAPTLKATKAKAAKAAKEAKEALIEGGELDSPQAFQLGSTQKILVRLNGLKPGILFQGKGIMLEDQKGATTGCGGPRKHRPAAEEAALRCHWVPKSMLDKSDLEGARYHEVNGDIPCITWVMIYKCICEAAKAFKYKNRKSYVETVAATVSCEKPDCQRIPIESTEYEVFEEFCRIPPRTGAMVMIGRPLFKEWAIEFTMLVDDESYDCGILQAIIQHAGKIVGLGAWRPQLKGPYGRFTVEKFEFID